MLVIPPDRIDAETLRSLLESYISREGTDYGSEEFSLEQKVNLLLPQVLAGEVLITFDEDTESINLVNKHALERNPNSSE